MDSYSIMHDPSVTIVLVTPVWNDSSRLASFGAELAVALAASPLMVHWVIADDGSGDHEREPLHQLREAFIKVFPKVHLHFAAEHLGKGAVVREAWATRTDADWLTFVDADGSVTPEEKLRLIATALELDQSVIGIRRRTETTEIVESPWRGLFHRGFLTAAQWLLGLQCEDPQCGAKVLRAPDYRRVADQLSENGLAFDSELLCALKHGGATWREIPVSWIEKPGGKVKPLRDAWSMLAALLRIRKRMPPR
jgi:glycosyltransferase involved in cell wall biosynthesis